MSGKSRAVVCAVQACALASPQPGRPPGDREPRPRERAAAARRRPGPPGESNYEHDTTACVLVGPPSPSPVAAGWAPQAHQHTHSPWYTYTHQPTASAAATRQEAHTHKSSIPVAGHNNPKFTLLPPYERCAVCTRRPKRACRLLPGQHLAGTASNRHKAGHLPRLPPEAGYPPPPPLRGAVLWAAATAAAAATSSPQLAAVCAGPSPIGVSSTMLRGMSRAVALAALLCLLCMATAQEDTSTTLSHEINFAPAAEVSNADDIDPAGKCRGRPAPSRLAGQACLQQRRNPGRLLPSRAVPAADMCA